MRSLWVYVSLSTIFLLISSPIAIAERYPILPREDQSPSSSTAASPSDVTPGAKASDTKQSDTTLSTTASPKPSSSPSPDASASDHNAETGKSASPSRTAAKPTSALHAASSSDQILNSATPTANSSLIEPLNGTANSNPDGLPIHPTITPALSVAGAYLILSGAIYLLIGIRTKWLHIFLSAAYLTSLAVTILIIYVMHPPISNAVQGAYFIAAFLTGIVFGGGSVVFADVTEGLGCLLGGFCLSMWFLVLKPGGLLTSTAGKAIFIACFTLGAFAFYVSHYTRPYGLIGSISFAGASVIVLGIDCFSRAGLKEFWLYIWDLNHDLFPPHYNEPYPITRGIRVEIACTVLLFLLGIMSQMKVWKIIKERREQKAAAELEEVQRREKAEEDLGRKLEEGNEQERAMWEAVYGDQDNSKRQQIDSGIGTDTSGSLRKGSVSAVGAREMRNSGSESIEMSNLDAPGGSSQRASHDESQAHEHSRMTVRVASDDVIQKTPLASFEHLASESRFSEISTGTSILDPAASMTRIVPSADLISSVLNQVKAAPAKFRNSGPKVVPLPFTVPDSDARRDDEDDVSSIATFAASDRFPQGSKRMSSSSLLRSFSKRSQRHSRNASISEEALVIPHVEDDQASSVAATIDGVSTDRDSDDEAASVAEEFAKSESPNHKDSKELNSKDNGLEPGTERGGYDQITDLAEKADEQDPSRFTDKTQLNSKKNDFEPFQEGSFAGVKKPGKLSDSLVHLGGADTAMQNRKSRENPEIPEIADVPMNLSGHLPGSTSKVVMAYRTNEWAKHLEAAETPELDDLVSVNAPNPTVAEKEEAAVPVRITDLQQTPLTAEPAPMPIDRPPQPTVNRSSSSTSKESLHQSLQQTESSQQIGSSRRHASGGNVERSSSQTSLQSIQNRKESPSSTLTRLPSSQTSLITNRGFRSSSTPLVSSPFVESPIEEGVESSFPARFTPSPMHLISHRDNMIRNRVSSTSLNRTPSSSSLTPIASPSNGPPMPQALPTLNEDISLSARKSILQQHPSRSSLAMQQTPSRLSLALQQDPSRSSLALQQPNPSSSSVLQQHPSRSASNPREFTLSAWRSSLRADLPTQQAAQQEIEARRSEMIHEKRRASTTQQWAQLESGRRESTMDKGMRRGDLLDKHREAMRRMQSEANRKLS